MLNNFSGDGKNPNGSDASSLEISVPLGQLFPFARTDVFPTGVQARIDLTITDDWPLAQAFVIISAVPSSQT